MVVQADDAETDAVEEAAMGATEEEEEEEEEVEDRRPTRAEMRKRVQITLHRQHRKSPDPTGLVETL